MSNYNSTLQSNNTDLQAILNTINELPEAGGEQATPVISINSSNGLITATAGTKTSTHQLAFQPAKTIRPSTTNQIAVSSGYYTGGNVTVTGDANLVAWNIKSGVSIFGVSGTYAGSGGGDTSVEDGFVTRTLTSYTNNRVTSIGSSAFYYFKNLKTIDFPAVTTIGKEAFRGCATLTTANFPNAKSINMSAFSYCTKLATISFPLAENIGTTAFCNCTTLASVYFPKALTIGNSAFGYCTKLTTVSLPAAQNIDSRAFIQCSNLKSLYLSGSSVCFLYDSNAFSYTPIGGFSDTAGTYGSIYVPTSLLTSYKRATNWTYFSSRFVGI